MKYGFILMKPSHEGKISKPRPFNPNDLPPDHLPLPSDPHLAHGLASMAASALRTSNASLRSKPSACAESEEVRRQVWNHLASAARQQKKGVTDPDPVRKFGLLASVIRHWPKPPLPTHTAITCA